MIYLHLVSSFSLYLTGRILDYVTQPVNIELPLSHPETTNLLQVACGRAHTVIVTDKEGSNDKAQFVIMHALKLYLTMPSLCIFHCSLHIRE